MDAPEATRPAATGPAPAGILINSWLAEDLHAGPGDVLTLTYYVVGPGRTLQTRRRDFRVRGVVKMQGPARDPDLMPAFPGLADVRNCRDWKPGVDIDLKRIRPKDEDYWNRFRGTPKAFVTLRSARRMWANRFGDLTAVRFPRRGRTPKELARKILQRLEPSGLGLVFRPVRRRALAAAKQALDFGQLFIGFSMFLIASAVLLTGLLFVLGVQQRCGEVGVLLAKLA